MEELKLTSLGEEPGLPGLVRLCFKVDEIWNNSRRLFFWVYSTFPSSSRGIPLKGTVFFLVYTIPSHLFHVEPDVP